MLYNNIFLDVLVIQVSIKKNLGKGNIVGKHSPCSTFKQVSTIVHSQNTPDRVFSSKVTCERERKQGARAGAGAPFSKAPGPEHFGERFFFLNIYIFYILMHICQQKQVE